MNGDDVLASKDVFLLLILLHASTCVSTFSAYSGNILVSSNNQGGSTQLSVTFSGREVIRRRLNMTPEQEQVGLA